MQTGAVQINTRIGLWQSDVPDIDSIAGYLGVQPTQGATGDCPWVMGGTQGRRYDVRQLLAASERVLNQMQMGGSVSLPSDDAHA